MKKLLDKYFVGIVLVIAGAIIIAWNELLATHPYATILVSIIIIGILPIVKKIKRKKSS